ncbi:MAG: class I SAM-dependent methyltransferase [Flavisolibacter sp.]
MSTIHYIHCPVCGSPHIDPLMGVKDHSVSGEQFAVWLCRDCSLRFTQDVPDENSIGPYYASPEYISHSNTDKGMLNKVYQAVRKRTLEGKAKLVISNTVSKGSLLDVGAGIGAFLNVMKEKGWDVTGVEPDAGARKNAKELFDLELETTDRFYSLQENSFDAITLWHVLEHVHDLHRYVEQLKSLLKPDGRIFIAVPNYSAYDADKYKSYWAAYDVPRHLYHFSPEAVRRLVEQHGLKILGKKPMWYDSFYISLLSSKYKGKNVGWIGAAFTGLVSNARALLNTDNCSSVIYVVGKG